MSPGIGPDIKEVIQEVGTPFTILRDAGNVTGEYLIYKTNRQVTKPFVREYFLEALLQHDTVAGSGDILSVSSDSRVFLLAVKTPRNFEGVAYDNQCTILKCNVSGELQRLTVSGESVDDQYNDDYELNTYWQTVKSNCYGLLTEELYGNFLEDSPAGKLLNKGMSLLVPSSVGIQTLDRYVPVSGEAWQVEEIERYVYEGLDIAHVEIDERED